MTTIPRICIGLAGALVVLGSAAALAQDSYDYRRNANLAGIRTFSFKETPPIDPIAEKTTTFDSPLVRDRTWAAIAWQLEQRGMRRDDKHPDVYIVTHRSYHVEYTYYGSPYPYYGYAGWAPYGYGGGWWDGGVFEQLRGTLTVDIADARTGDLLWRGVEEGNVHQKSKPEKRDKRVVKEVAEIFEHFPVFPRAVATTGVSGAVSTTGRR